MKWSATAPWAGSFRPVPGALIATHLRLVRPLTSPGAQHVWVADHLVLQTEVAVKFCPTPDGSERFLRQARCTAHVADPHLLQVLEPGKIKGCAFLVTELLEGRSLRQRLLAGPLALSEARAVLLQTAGVLAKSHALGLWHGSLCPEHLFSTETAGEPFIKLSAFGDAFRVASDRAYLSPEQVLQGAGGASSDLWALAVTLYELLTSTLPFRASTEAALSVAICNGQFSPPSQYRSDLPPFVDAWFERALAKGPAARLVDPLEWADEFVRATTTARGTENRRSELGRRQGTQASSAADRDHYDDAEERTMRWALPADWALPSSGGVPPSISPSSTSARSSGPSPLPSPSSSRPPVWALPSEVPQLSRTTTPNALSQPARSASRFAKTMGLLAGAVLGAAGVLAAWAYQSFESAEGVPKTAAAMAVVPLVLAEPAPAAPVSTSPAPTAPTGAPRVATQPLQGGEQLPVILRTDELPNAPDEVPLEDPEAEPLNAAAALDVVSVAAEVAVGGSSPVSATAQVAGTSHAGAKEGAHERANDGANEGNGAPARASSAAVAVRRDAPTRRAKPTSTVDACNPPYFFDENKIQRLKLECL